MALRPGRHGLGRQAAAWVGGGGCHAAAALAGAGAEAPQVAGKRGREVVGLRVLLRQRERLLLQVTRVSRVLDLREDCACTRAAVLTCALSHTAMAGGLHLRAHVLSLPTCACVRRGSSWVPRWLGTLLAGYFAGWVLGTLLAGCWVPCWLGTSLAGCGAC